MWGYILRAPRFCAFDLATFTKLLKFSKRILGLAHAQNLAARSITPTHGRNPLPNPFSFFCLLNYYLPLYNPFLRCQIQQVNPFRIGGQVGLKNYMTGR